MNVIDISDEDSDVEVIEKTITSQEKVAHLIAKENNSNKRSFDELDTDNDDESGCSLSSEEYQLSRAISESNKDVTNYQDLSYVQSLNEDRRKRTLKIKQKEHEDEAARLDTALSLSSESAREDAENRRQWLLSKLPPEPSKDSPNCLSVCFRLPSKAQASRLFRRFCILSDTPATLLDFLRSRKELEGIRWDLKSDSKVSMGCVSSKGENISLEKYNFGTRVLLWIIDLDS